jgi:hypothetical protein
MRSLAITLLTFELIVVLSSLAGVQAASQPNAGQSDLGPNAALQYWQAFAQMPPLDAEREKILAEWNTVRLDDPAVQKLIAESHASMMYLRRAANLERCDWGLDYNDGISMMLPHLAKSRGLAHLAALHVRNEMQRGNTGALGAHATAIMVLARHVGRDPFMVCLLVRYSIEETVVDLVAPYVPQIKVPYDRSVAMFKELPLAPSAAHTIAAERKFFVEWMPKELRRAEEGQKGAGLKLWKAMLGSETPDEFKQIDSLEAVIQSIEGMYPVYDELENLVALPQSEFEVQYPAFKERVQNTTPLTRILLPAIDKVMAKEYRNQARMAMLLAGIAVTESGQDTLKDIQDPFGNGPFEYRALDKGFELRSKLLFEGQPVTLTLAPPR